MNLETELTDFLKYFMKESGQEKEVENMYFYRDWINEYKDKYPEKFITKTTSLNIEDLIKRQIIRNDKAFEYLNKMSDAEISQYVNDVEQNMLKQGMSKDYPEWNSEFISKIIDDETLYQTLKYTNKKYNIKDETLNELAKAIFPILYKNVETGYHENGLGRWNDVNISFKYISNQGGANVEDLNIEFKENEYFDKSTLREIEELCKYLNYTPLDDREENKNKPFKWDFYTYGLFKKWQNMNNYIQTDELQSYIDWDNIMIMPRYAGGHDEQMQGLFKNVTVIAHWNQNDYQGMVATCVKFNDGKFEGKFAIYNDYYGSCSGCDSWEDADDKSVRNMCIQLSNSAYLFDDLIAVKLFLENINDTKNYSWDECSKYLLEIINKN